MQAERSLHRVRCVLLRSERSCPLAGRCTVMTKKEGGPLQRYDGEVVAGSGKMMLDSVIMHCKLAV